ncbi:MAG: endopeptidase La [Clostridiaceae bacterium]|nr:endopeptidase La [Clostridiaceae bacterium]
MKYTRARVIKDTDGQEPGEIDLVEEETVSSDASKKEGKTTLPAIALRGVTLFPHTTSELDIGRRKSVSAILEAHIGGRIILIPQLDDSVVAPRTSQLASVGTLAKINDVSHGDNGTVTVEFSGLHRVKILSYTQTSPCFIVEYEKLKQTNYDTITAQAYYRNILTLLSDNTEILNNVDESVNGMWSDINGFIDKLAGTLVFNKNFDLLIEPDTEIRLARLAQRLAGEIEIIKAEKEISKRVKQSIDRGQREYFLREQISAIQEELGEGKENRELSQKIEKLPVSDEIKEKLKKDIAKNAKMPMSSPDYGVTRNYLEFVTELPWEVRTEDSRDLKKAKEILDDEHFGLEKIKDRIIEFLAVHQLTQEKKEPILCFVGPPGVGKTSIVRSIAQALNRKYVRMSVGGVRDEAEIRGHRKTYVGAMPGRILANIKLAGTVNPVFLLDEIDKLASDFRGDPSSALLEVLDPEQNNTFRDNYMEIPFDLSDVIFITTANTTDTIPPALLDRMEIIEMSGYTPLEKKEIALRHLYAKQLRANGVSALQIEFADGVTEKMIEGYTRESGVRNLEKLIAQVMRKAARRIVEGEDGKITVTCENLEDFLGIPRYSKSDANKSDEVGTVTGLAWTVFGGEILNIEVSLMNGKGDVILTGQLGDVMKESARTAISYIHAHAADYGISEELFKSKDIHIHIPEGAIPKDGPSAGITLATAVLSALTGKGAKCDVAMTGEITLRGKVLPIGGLKEKLLAAHRAGIKKVILPTDNKKDLMDIPDIIKRELTISYVTDINQVFGQAII